MTEKKRVVVIELVVTGRDADAAFDIVDGMLDAGDLQDDLEECARDTDRSLKVTSAVVRGRCAWS